ncbi:drug/metabolite transporter (DMT)-like permease [Symbiobacterium terraclitae]|uniref:Drug/metabolite transporter (DMT)-like permease n=1 Tax=Symbiobacterium terraclitae TaxID=557451 RepID=A0ABS4JMM8_9FIRM|nr:EamA family transporter [Symbiobacterium terraclitae]MBP2016793.1 drug/metabolite transporter (DMT)-like permease [Symbiobacterium terraclitae]
MSPVHGRRLLGDLLVIAGASLWGTLGIVVKSLYESGLSTEVIVTVRATLATVLLLALLGTIRPALLRVHLRDVPLFALYGLVSVAAFNLLYFATIQRLSVAAAAVLMYTAPAFVAVASYLTLGEPLTRTKVTALVLTLVGCALVARAYEPDTFRGQALGLLTGLGSGFTYGMYSVFGKHALKRYKTWTVQVYALAAGALPLLLLYGREAAVTVVRSPQGIPGLLYLALVTTLGAYGLYLAGLQRVEASRASIISTIEPVIAALLGFWVLHESLSLAQVAGIVLVLVSAIVLNLPAETSGAAAEGGGAAADGGSVSGD